MELLPAGADAMDSKSPCRHAMYQSGRRNASVTGECRTQATEFLLQRTSEAIEHGNAAAYSSIVGILWTMDAPKRVFSLRPNRTESGS